MFEKKPQFIELADLVGIADQIPIQKRKDKIKISQQPVETPVVDKIELPKIQEPVVSKLSEITINQQKTTPEVPKLKVTSKITKSTLEDYLGADIKWIF